jgi:hypothetical protein
VSSLGGSLKSGNTEFPTASRLPRFSPDKVEYRDPSSAMQAFRRHLFALPSDCTRIAPARQARKIFQRTLVARFIPMNHARSGKRDHLHRNFQISGVFSRLEIESRERNSKALTVHVEGFAGNDTRVRNNEEVAGFSVKFWIALGAAAEHVFAADTKIGIILDQDILRRSAPPGTRPWIGEFGKNRSTAAGYERSNVIVACCGFPFMPLPYQSHTHRFSLRFRASSRETRSTKPQCAKRCDSGHPTGETGSATSPTCETAKWNANNGRKRVYRS